MTSLFTSQTTLLIRPRLLRTNGHHISGVLLHMYLPLYVQLLHINVCFTASFLSSQSRGLMILLHILTPYCLRKLFDWLEKKLRSHDSQEIPIETREFLLKCIPVVKAVVLYTHRLHMAAFYLQGFFYQIAKRFNGVHYVSECIYQNQAL